MVDMTRALSDDSKLYVDLLKVALTGALFEDGDTVLGKNVRGVGLLHKVANGVARAASAANLEIAIKRPYTPELREVGRDWPARAESMIGLRRMENIQTCVEEVLKDGVPGDLIETGVWRGGAVIFMRGLLRAYNDQERCVWVADSFEGLPPPDGARFPADTGGRHHLFTPLQINVEQVRNNFRRYNLLDDRVRFLVGWFRDTLPNAPIDRLALLRLDGDMYESTWDALSALYAKLSVGGFCIVDDYGNIPACRRAVEDFREANRITEAIIDIDGFGVYWRKERD